MCVEVLIRIVTVRDCVGHRGEYERRAGEVAGSARLSKWEREIVVAGRKDGAFANETRLLVVCVCAVPTYRSKHDNEGMETGIDKADTTLER